MKSVFWVLFIGVLSFYDNAHSQAELVTLVQLEHRIKAAGDTTLVVNFWATWCSPCVEELPFFEAFHKTNYDKKIRVLLVSLDFPSQRENKVIPFLKKNAYSVPVILLNETDANLYIDRIHPQWGGSIPATLLIHPASGRRQFYEKKFESAEEVNQTIQSFIERK